MSSPTLRALIIGFAMASSTPTFAQPIAASGDANAGSSVATIGASSGRVWVSRNNGPFIAATPNQALDTGARVLVASRGHATLNFHSGCTQTFTQPGVYTVTASCQSPDAVTGWADPPDSTTAVNGASVGAAVAAQRCDCMVQSLAGPAG